MKHAVRMALLGAWVVTMIFPTPALADDNGETAAVTEETAHTASQCPICRSKMRFNELTPGLTSGADLRLREVYAPNLISLDKETNGHDWHYQRYRARVWTRFTPSESGIALLEPLDGVALNVRLLYEPMSFCKPNGNEHPTRNEVIFDNLNVQWSKPFGLPLKITAGRQDIILGTGWLVLDGTPLDDSRTIFFDALRATVDIEDWNTVLDGIFVSQRGESADGWLPAMNDQDFHNAEQNEHGVILYATNKSLENTTLEGYYIYKHDNAIQSTGRSGDVHTVGARAAGAITERMGYSAEVAHQFGRRNLASVAAWGVNSELTYTLPDCPWQGRLRLAYEFISGDDPWTPTNEQFETPWGRWARFSELYLYSIIPESGRGAEATNLHRVGFGWDAKPCKRLDVTANYQLLFRDESLLGAGATGGGCFRGQLLAGIAKYQINPHIATHVVAELFFPGSFYTEARNDVAGFFRYELAFTW